MPPDQSLLVMVRFLSIRSPDSTRGLHSRGVPARPSPKNQLAVAALGAQLVRRLPRRASGRHCLVVHVQRQVAL